MTEKKMNEFDDINFKGLMKPVKKHRVKNFFKAIGKKCWPHIKTGREVEDTAGKLNVEHYLNIAKGFFRNKARNLRAAAARILAEHQGAVPDRMEDFRDFTRRNVKRSLAIIVDGRVTSAP